ncbi:hypothetical protein DCCM_3812 [Desulfocucumis palustris]|uniref:Uncharacterized protein n=1 Tax=Desulfocucumis palustris TaxID=1898651 RepID=A0A2L2XEY2_9FIRM|nr:hypothetical protein DCCM_3812 [Desulfocucumis palustris]
MPTVQERFKPSHNKNAAVMIHCFTNQFMASIGSLKVQTVTPPFVTILACFFIFSCPVAFSGWTSA